MCTNCPPTEKNWDLLERVHKQITSYPSSHYQGSWQTPQAIWETVDDVVRFEQFKGVNSCGTTRCIAGWALVLHTNEADPWEAARRVNGVSDSLVAGLNIPDTASRVLGLTREEGNSIYYLTEHEAVEKLEEWLDERPS